MEITIINFNESIEDFYKTVNRIDTFWHDDKPYSVNIDLDNSYDSDTKQLFKGFNELRRRKSKLDILEKYINLRFDKLFLFSHENNIFFQNCSFTVYESTFESRFIEYKNTYVDTSVFDFLELERDSLIQDISLKLFGMSNDTNTKRISDSIRKKNKFLETKIKYLDTLSQQPEPEPLDLHDNKPLEKIALLYESGIIDFLHKKDGKPHTVNSIASLLSGITGVEAKTIQSAINPFINTHSTSKGTPAKSTLNKAKSKLIELGF